MHHFIFPTQDTWISSGSSTIDGTSFKDQNFGRDQILEVKKEFYNSSFNYQTRALVQFGGTDFTELSKSVANGTITNPTYFLRLYEAEGNTEFGTDISYNLAFHPISESWVEGTGKFGASPKITDGCSWENRSNITNGSATSWSMHGVTTCSLETTGTPISHSGQLFANQSPDVEVDVSDMVKMWISQSADNNGIVIRFSGAQETDSLHFGHLKFFSRNTHTIYAPRLEVRWDDHNPITGSNTGSLNELTMSGLVDNYLYVRGLREFYRENERVKFRVGARKRYIQKNFSTSVQTVTGSYVAESSSSYAIKDIATDEFVVPFSGYTSMSCDTEGMYFNQWLDGFYPDRAYKILLKLQTNDGQEQVFDDGFEFVVKRS
tara:strand:- start:1399 stop:2529 length:1131 start_codon:yes stop_codon:yes gene_type:complete